MESSTISGLVFLVFGFAVFIHGASLYFGLVRLRQANDHAWCSLNTQLKEYAQEVTKLCDITGNLLPGDKTSALLAQSLADFMQDASAKKKSEAFAQLSAALGAVMASVQSHSPSASHEDFLKIWNHMKVLERNISVLAKAFNAGATDYNRRIGQTPDVIVASIAGLERMDLFPAEQQNPV